MRSIIEARAVGDDLHSLLAQRKLTAAYDHLSPVLTTRTSFRLLDVIGEKIGDCERQSLDLFLDQIAAGKSMGGWVVIASALSQRFPHDLQDAFTHTHDYIISADTWYATDIFGERVPGPALMQDFEHTLALLEPWREEDNHWVRRIIGVAVHFWAKRTRGTANNTDQVRKLLSLLEPLYEEKDTAAVKGIAWGLKTLGRYYPDQVTVWLKEQVLQHGRKARRLMTRKAMTYLPPEHVARITEALEE